MCISGMRVLFIVGVSSSVLVMMTIRMGMRFGSVLSIVRGWGCELGLEGKGRGWICSSMWFWLLDFGLRDLQYGEA